MNIDGIKELMKQFDKSSITKMKLEIEGVKLLLEKEATSSKTPINITKQPDEIEIKKDEEIFLGEEIKAPIVGVFYSKSSPEAKPFVEVGQHVNIGDTLCIIEAMKVMNEIKATQSGIITSIQVKDEDLVEFDQVIMTIQG